MDMKSMSRYSKNRLFVQVTVVSQTRYALNIDGEMGDYIWYKE